VLMLSYSEKGTINVGTGLDITIAELAETVREVVGYEGKITLDRSKPDGMMRKVLDVRRIKALGWQPKVSLEEGLAKAYHWAVDNGVFERQWPDAR